MSSPEPLDLLVAGLLGIETQSLGLTKVRRNQFETDSTPSSPLFSASINFRLKTTRLNNVKKSNNFIEL